MIVELGYRRVQVQLVPLHELEGRVGEFQAHAGVIRVAKDLPPLEEAHTLLHELLHLVYTARGVSPLDDEERTVGALAEGLTELLSRNPELLERIAELVG